MSGVNKLYRWVKTILSSSEKARDEVIKNTLQEITAFNITETEEFIDAVHDGRLEFIGIAPEIRYLRTKGDETDLESIWVHRFGTPKLLYKVKNAPILIIAGSHLKLNESDVLPLNGGSREVRGITG